MDDNALVVLSGGLDSTTVLAKCIESFEQENVRAIAFTYGQRHVREIGAACDIAKYYGIPLDIYDISDIFYGNQNALTNQDVEMPEGTYESQGDAPATEVPFRNGIFLSIAASLAMEKGITFVYCGIHADDDRSAYADTSPAFFDGMRLAVAAGTHNKVTLRAPFLDSTKADIVRDGYRLGVPFQLTWSCYKGEDKPCGKCATCLQRAAAFKEAGIKDPLVPEELESEELESKEQVSE